MERDHSDSDFSVVGLTYSGSEAVITLAGELDLASAPVLHELLLEAASGGADTITIDIKRLTYIDSAGLGVLVSAHKRLQSNGGSLVISAADRTNYASACSLGVDQVLHNQDLRPRDPDSAPR